jgi:hypothetical protein
VVNPKLSTNTIPYPTPHMARLFSLLCAEVDLLRQLLGDREIQVTVPMNGMTHARILEEVNEMFVSADPALSFFLAYPTRRLSTALIKAAADAASAVAWLAQNPPTDWTVTDLVQEYDACCERVRSGIRDWRLSVDLKRVERDLDFGPAETVH